MPFLIAGVVLLIAMLGSIVLTTRLVVPAGGTHARPENKNSLPKSVDNISEEERKRILTEVPSMFADLVEQQKLEREMPLS